MLEEYFIKGYEDLKKENEDLKNKIIELENSEVISLPDKAIKMELIPLNTILERLENEGIDYIKVVEEWNSSDIYDLIVNLKLAKRMTDYNEPVIKFKNQLWTIKKDYSRYELDGYETFTTEKDYITCVLVDKLYDQLNQHRKNKIVEETKNKEEK